MECVSHIEHSERWDPVALYASNIAATVCESPWLENPCFPTPKWAFGSGGYLFKPEPAHIWERNAQIPCFVQVADLNARVGLRYQLQILTPECVPPPIQRATTYGPLAMSGC